MREGEDLESRERRGRAPSYESKKMRKEVMTRGGKVQIMRGRRKARSEKV